MRRPALVGPLLAAVLVLSACGVDDDAPASVARPSGSASASASPTDPPSSAATAPELPAPTGSYERYVALGDSFTAAPLASETDVSDGCGRSVDNYPALVASALGGAELADVSCSGAETTSLIGAQQTPRGVVPPQFDAVTPETDLVTIGIGGNDFEIFSRLIQQCSSLRAEDPEGAPCRDAATKGGTDQLLADVEKLGPRLESVVAGLKDRAPDAKIVVVGYPSSIPDSGTCPALLPLAEGDYAYAASVNEQLAQTQKKAAERAGVTYIDTFAASKGHDICSEDPWVNGMVTSERTALAYHPLQAEQEALAALILAEL